MAHTFQLITYSEVHMQDIKDYLSYDPLTGLFTHLTKWGKRDIGTEAGTLDHYGYVVITYKGKQYKAHRLAWYFFYNVMPSTIVDHINGIKHDNSIDNLREISHIGNHQNVNGVRKSNTSGFTGIHFNRRRGKWVAEINVYGVGKYLGQYDTPEDAHAAYVCAKREHHPFWVENK